MKANRTWLLPLLAVVAVFAVVLGADPAYRAVGSWLDAHPVLQERASNLLVYGDADGPDAGDSECGSAGCSITPSAEQIMAYLKVTPAETISLTWTGKIRLTNLQEYIGSFESAQVRAFDVASTSMTPWRIQGTSLSHEAPAGVQALVPGGATDWTAWEVLTSGPDPLPSGGIDYGYLLAWTGTETDPDEIELDFTATITNLELRVERTSPYAPTGEGVRGARKPEDHALGYQWVVMETSQVTLVVEGPLYNQNGNPITIEWTQEWQGDYGSPITLDTAVLGTLHDGLADTTYLEIEANCSGYPVLFDGLDTDFYSDRANLSGSGNMASWKMLVSYDAVHGAPGTASAGITAWHAVDLSHLGVYTAERGELHQLLDTCLVSIFGYTATVAQWRALGVAIIQYSSWLGWQSNMDGVFDGTCAGPLCAPEVDATWAEEHGHNPGDVRIHIDAGGLDWACQGSPYRRLLTVNHLTNLEVFNPSLAATCPATATLPTGITGAWATSHAEFPGLGAGWKFAVGEDPESRQITIALRSNMEDRIEQAKLGPLFSPPAGYDPTWTPPSIPECHRIRAAGGWQPTKEPAESRCDWDNFAWLRAVLACSGAWTAEDCTFEVGYYTPTVTDNFKSGDDRRTGGEDGDPYDVDWGSLQWLEFEVVAPSDGEDGNRYIDLLFPVSWEEGGTGQVVPDLRFVRAVRLTLPEAAQGEEVFLGAHLSGPVASGWASDTAAGAHVLALHPTVPEETEGTDSHGPDVGWSIVTDGKPGARTVQLWKRRTEEGIPYYYYVVGAVSGYDLGTGSAWQQAAAELNKQEGFSCAEDTAAYEDMCYEEGDTEQGKLWEPQAYDAREGDEDTGRLHYGADGAVEVWFAQRVRSVYPPPLRVYHLYALKHLAGGVWGTAKRKTLPEPDPEHGHVRERTWQQDPYGYYGYGSGGGSEEWALLGSAYPSGASPLVLWPMVTGQQFTTGIGVTATTVETLGVMPCREFYWWSPLASAGGGGVFLAQDIAGIVWRVTTNEAGLLRAYWFEPHRADPEWHEADAHPFGDDEGFERPSVYCDLDGSLLVAATLDGDTVIARSRTCGADWEEVTMPHIGSGIAYGTLGGDFSGVALCGNDGTDVLLRLSSREDLVAEDLATGVDELVVCAAPDAEALTAVLHLGGEIIVAVQSGDDTLTYRARDFAEDGFEEVVA